MWKRISRRIRRITSPPSHTPAAYKAPPPAPDLSVWSPPHPLSPALHPTLRAALSSGNLGSCVEVLGPSLYRLPVLSEASLLQLTEYIDSILHWIEAQRVSTDPPNSMHQYGLILSELVWASPLRLLLDQAILPLAQHLFADVGGETLDGLHTFVVDYGWDRDRDLGFHVDNS